MWFLILILTVLGLLSIIKPQATWFLTNWWRYRGEAEASDGSLLLYRILGFGYLIAAIFLIYRQYL